MVLLGPTSFCTLVLLSSDGTITSVLLGQGSEFLSKLPSLVRLGREVGNIGLQDGTQHGEVNMCFIFPQ